MEKKIIYLPNETFSNPLKYLHNLRWQVTLQQFHLKHWELFSRSDEISEQKKVKRPIFWLANKVGCVPINSSHSLILLISLLDFIKQKLKPPFISSNTQLLKLKNHFVYFGNKRLRNRKQSDTSGRQWVIKGSEIWSCKCKTVFRYGLLETESH